MPVLLGASSPSHPRRRDMLAYIGVSVAALGFSPNLRAQTPQATIFARMGDNQRFDPAAVVDLARQLAKKPFVQPPNDLPDFFSNLTYEQYIAIKSRQPPIWGNEARGIAVEPLHRGFVFTNAVDLYLVEDGAVRRVGYDPSQFDYGQPNPPNNLGDIGFSGFRLVATSGDGTPFDFALVQGATFFRARARGQNFGAIARALTLKPADPKGEEFPIFRAFWLERPAVGSNSITAHAVVDSESTTGAVRMTFRPGDMTIVDVETTLFPRVNLEHVGLGGIGSTYFYGPNDRRSADDIRVAAYESAGLQMHNGQGEWLWRPLHNPETLQISAFVDNSPRGFGLLQRDRSYEAFQDDNQRFELRPSLWIEPLGDWGQGSVQLLEIPTDAEINDNILTYWRPKVPMAAGSEVSFAYRQYWCWTPPERPPLATVTSTRVGRGSAGRRQRFAVDFSTETLGENLPADLRSVLTVSPGTFQDLKNWVYPERNTVRVAFELDPGNENACEMRLILEAGGKPISETWLYRWTP
ncbi:MULTISPECIES: glucan biosynthesis protein [Microvirga]|uniref:glucan biosynthesis protein n=1 Tax=Microvirga TaxID=186650 RepID=UPI001CFFA9BD|nr:glucan biosynthesis protein D [Microvirga lenta]MCB5177401.1 glucan biosynthesis protein D [Microvirga lenta]